MINFKFGFCMKLASAGWDVNCGHDPDLHDPD